MKIVGVTAPFSGIGRASDHAMRRRRSGAGRLALAALAVVVVTASLGSVGAAAPPRSSVAGSLAQEEPSATQESATVDFSDAELQALMTRFTFWDNKDWVSFPPNRGGLV